MKLSTFFVGFSGLFFTGSDTILLGVSHAVRIPEPDVCKALASGSEKATCNFDWAVYHACDCYFQGDKQSTCEGYFKTVADACNGGTPNKFVAAEENICEVGYDGSKFKECDWDWGMYNACDCHYHGPDREEFCGKSKQGVDECEGKCKAERNCTLHC